MTRFVVGQTYTFLRVLFEKKNQTFSSLYYPWVDVLTDIEVINLTCSEHHKVAWDQDPDNEKKYDGFIFTDADGNRWSNQYPSACYSQLDSSCDYYVRRHFETEELLQVNEKGECINGPNDRALIKEGTEALWDIFDSQFWRPFVSAEKHLGNLYRTVFPRVNQNNSNIPPEHIQMLKDHLDELIKNVEKTSNKKVEFIPLVVNYTDGRPSQQTNFMQAHLVEKAPYSSGQYDQAVLRANRK